MSYRDDRDALRDHAEMLERELEAARAELSRVRGSAGEPAEPAPALVPSTNIAIVLVPMLIALGVFGLRISPALALGAFAISIAFIVLLVAASGMIGFARASEALVLSGRARDTAEHRRVGFRVVRGGRGVRLPLLEAAARLDLGVFRVPIAVRQARTFDGQAVDIDLLVHARLDREGPGLDRAIERLLSTHSAQKIEIVATALDSVVRETCATLDPRELHRQRAHIADALLRAAKEPLGRFGVVPIAVYLLDVRGTGDP